MHAVTNLLRESRRSGIKSTKSITGQRRTESSNNTGRSGIKSTKSITGQRRTESSNNTDRSGKDNEDEADIKETAEDKPGDDYDYDYLFKVVLIGDSGVGKSNLISRFTNQGFNESHRSTHIPISTTRKLIMDGEIIKAQIWDTNGDYRFRALTTPYEGTKGVLIVYNVTKRSTFANVERWVKELRAKSDPNIIVMLVGNMIDDINLREVSSEEGKSFAERESLYFMETSALESINVYDAFSQLITMIYLKTVGKKSITTIEDGGRDIIAVIRNNDASKQNLVQKDHIVQQSEIHGTNTNTSSTREGLVSTHDDGVGDVDHHDFYAISTSPENSSASSLTADGHIIDDNLPKTEELGFSSPEDGESLPFQTKSDDEISSPEDNHNDQSAQVMSRNFTLKETSAFENHNDSSTSETCQKCGASDDTISEILDVSKNNDQGSPENGGTFPAVHGNDGVGSSTIFKMEQTTEELQHSSLDIISLSNAKPNLRPVEDIAYYMFWEHITWTETSPMASPACLHQPTSCHFCKIFELGEVSKDRNSLEVEKSVSKGKEVRSEEIDKIAKQATSRQTTGKNRRLVISRRKLSSSRPTSSTTNEVSDSENHNEQTLAIRGTSNVVYGLAVSGSGQINMKDTTNKINYGNITNHFQYQIPKFARRKKRLVRVPARDTSEVEVPNLTRAGKYNRLKEESLPWVTIGCLTLSFPLLLFLLYRRRETSVIVLP